jgi:dihydroxyacid dehydratase/phosphogluconate dehydratase
VGDDRQPTPSRALLEGPARAPARSYLRNIGYTERQLRQPIVGVSHSWTSDLTEQPGQRVVASADRPFAAEGALAVLYGNLAPEGSVTKTGLHGPRSHRGPAWVFECEEDAIAIDVPGRRLEVKGVDLPARPRTRREPYSGALAHYALLVSSASRGAVLAGLDDADHYQAGA